MDWYGNIPHFVEAHKVNDQYYVELGNDDFY